MTKNVKNVNKQSEEVWKINMQRKRKFFWKDKNYKRDLQSWS